MPGRHGDTTRPDGPAATYIVFGVANDDDFALGECVSVGMRSLGFRLEMRSCRGQGRGCNMRPLDVLIAEAAERKPMPKPVVR